jgi:putative Mg2+ transporter-C (MgtC) family protein
LSPTFVTGIGFLGAVVIFKYENRVNGITTAATIWAVSAVAMGIGASYCFPSGYAAFLILFTLVALPYVDRKISKNYHFTIVRVECIISDEVLQNLEDAIAKSGLKFDLISQRWDKETVVLA